MKFNPGELIEHNDPNGRVPSEHFQIIAMTPNGTQFRSGTKVLGDEMALARTGKAGFLIDTQFSKVKADDGCCCDTCCPGDGWHERVTGQVMELIETELEVV